MGRNSLALIFLVTFLCSAQGRAATSCVRALLETDTADVRYVYLTVPKSGLFKVSTLQDTFKQIIEALPPEVEPLGVFFEKPNRPLRPLEIRLRNVSVGQPWVRDWFPRLVLDEDGQPFLISSQPSYDKLSDESFRVMEKKFALPSKRIKVYIDWGNVIIDKSGTLITSLSKDLLRENAELFNISELQFKHRLKKHLQVRRAIWLPELPRELTGHVDMFVSYLGNNRIVVAASRESARAEALDESAEILAQAGYQVYRLFNGGSDIGDIPLSYTNSLLVNGRALVPVYSDYMIENYKSMRLPRVFWQLMEKLSLSQRASQDEKQFKAEKDQVFADDQAAIKLYSEMGFEVYPINMRKQLVDWGGMVHCLTACLPKEIAEILERGH